MSTLSPAPRRLPYTPRWPGAIEGYTVNTLRRSGVYGRLSAWLEFEDLLQEAYVVFARCKHRYAGRVTEPAWFMALYKTALHNRLSTLIVAHRKYSSFMDRNIAAPFPEAVGELENLGELCCLIAELPAEFAAVLEEAVLADTAALRAAAARQLRRWLRLGRKPVPALALSSVLREEKPLCRIPPPPRAPSTPNSARLRKRTPPRAKPRPIT